MKIPEGGGVSLPGLVEAGGGGRGWEGACGELGGGGGAKFFFFFGAEIPTWIFAKINNGLTSSSQNRSRLTCGP